jgi:hypothetical protein
MHRPSHKDHLPWPRFWSPRKSRAHGTSGEFLEDPQGLFGKHLHPQAATLSEITPETGLLVLCGEPGLGKTTELDLLRASLPATLGENERLIYLRARTFESFTDLQGHLDSHPVWQAWLLDDNRLTILLDGLDEGLIRMPTLVARLRSFLENKPTERLRLVLSCRSFEWPEAEGEQLASLWAKKENAGFIFELEPLRREDARLAAEQRGHDGDKFLEAVHRADVGSLASRPITLFFLLDEFRGEEFQATSRSQLYKNGCRRLCEENNPERAHLLRRFSREECSTAEKVDAAGKLACGLLIGGKHSIWFPTSSQSQATGGNVCHSTELIDSGLLRENAVEQALGTGVFTALGGDCFGFTHQTFAECLAGQTLTQLPLPQLRSLLCATDPASGAEYVIPQLIELAAWVAGDHSVFFAHLIEIDPAALLRSGVALTEPDQKARLVERILDLAGKNQFFDQSEYWRFWRDLDHPELTHQLIDALTAPQRHLMVRRVAIDIAEACRRPELVPTLFDILKSEDGDRYFRSSVADALCASMPDDRLAELEPLARGEVGSDPDQSIIGHALQRLVPRHWSVADALPFLGRTRNSNYFGSYRRALNDLPKHLDDRDILPGLRAIQDWEGGFSDTSYRRKLCVALLSRGLDQIYDPAVCTELVKLWTTKSRKYHAFFRKGDRNDSDFEMMKDEPRRKWIAAIVNASTSEPDARIDFLSWDTYRLIKPEDFGWILESLLRAEQKAAPTWASAVQRLLWNEEIRIAWWDEFIAAYRLSPALQAQMAWFEETSVDTPARRKTKANWLWHERRYERAMKRRRNNRKLPDPEFEFDFATAQISGGESWAFINLCWALSLNDEEQHNGDLKHDVTSYPGWKNITAEQKEFFHEAARRFLLERSDGWAEFGAQTNYFEPGIVAIWLLRDEIESDEELRGAVAGKWIEAILGMRDSSSDHAKDLFAFAYRLNPSQTINGWIREIWRDSEQHGHPFALRRAEKCFNDTLAREITELIKTLKHPKSVRMAIYELKDLNKRLAGELAAYLLQREIRTRRPNERMVEALIIAGLGTGSRQVWRLAFPVLSSQPELAKRVMLSVAKDADSRNKDLCEELTEDEVADFHLLLCRLFPYSEDPEEESGFVSPRRSVTHFRSAVLGTLSGRSTLAAVAQLSRLAKAFPDQATWLLYRSQQTLSAVRRNEWQPFPLPDLAVVLSNDRKRIIRDNGDLLNLVLESLDGLQKQLKETTLPAVEDLWQWEGAGLKRKNFRHKDEEAVSDYVARWLRDKIGPSSKVVVNREVQPRRGQRTDILVEAWSHSPNGRNRQEAPLSVTIEVKGCWNDEIKTGANNQLLDGYLRPFGRTHGIFLVAWFHSPGYAKLDPNQTTELKHQTMAHAEQAVAAYAKPAQISGFTIAPVVLDCRLP